MMKGSCNAYINESTAHEGAFCCNHYVIIFFASGGMSTKRVIRFCTGIRGLDWTWSNDFSKSQERGHMTSQIYSRGGMTEQEKDCSVATLLRT